MSFILVLKFSMYLFGYLKDGQGDNILQLVYNFFQLCINAGAIPELWEQVLIIPIFKKGDPGLILNYRPISLSQCIRKVFEKTIIDSLLPYLNPSNKTQFAFKSRHSIYDAVQRLTGLLEYIDRNYNKSKRAILLIDICKEFDTINRGYLINCLIGDLNCQSSIGIIYDLLNVNFQLSRIHQSIY